MHLAGDPKDYKVPGAAGEDPAIHSGSVLCCPLLATPSHGRSDYNKDSNKVYPDSSEETQEHADLSKALAQIREVIAAVDLSVSEYERQQRLQEVWSRMENRSSAKLKNGHTFRKQDMMGPGQTLKHQGLLLWKTATGRLKGGDDLYSCFSVCMLLSHHSNTFYLLFLTSIDVLALLLTDTLIFLQEKDQKYAFATVVRTH